MKHHLTTYSHIVLRKRYKDVTFSVMYETINGGLVEKFNEGTQSKTEKYKNIEALKILADNGRKYRLLPVIQDRQKNPDAFNLINLRYVDIKVAESTNGKNAIQSALKEANSQNVSEVIIYFTKKLDSNREAFNMLKATFRQKRAKNIEIIIFIMPDKRVLQVDTKRFK
ncbi:hypothetical protein JMN12_11400 [Capnocytophaga genosp. AHN8471]|jgi:hypothetical protein|uniref:tRNA nuclease CdiA C-terminal domain-containing protein n=1 Tax=Capnocytophaga endodontalis TaxID=2708117 RepID=A0A1Z4BSJ0_9FLAO|nr:MULTISPECIES: hypothetical protein [Capnocytophaga]ASF44267.1 hypothetical protein CBG49_14830 [Capnocytophaga endodontalis]MBM0657142.1 hypothetical protein [Capnocytophaga genosp. AHN8471]